MNYITVVYQVVYYIMSIYVNVCNYLSPKGIKYLSICQIIGDQFCDVSSTMNMGTLIPFYPLETGCYCVHYSINEHKYRRLFLSINPESIAGRLPDKKRVSTSTTILSAFDNEKDISELIKEYAGPRQDFYNEFTLQMKHLRILHGVTSLEVLTSKLEEFSLRDKNDVVNILT